MFSLLVSCRQNIEHPLSSIFALTAFFIIIVQSSDIPIEHILAFMCGSLRTHVYDWGQCLSYPPDLGQGLLLES
jgi:hypothetical protein